MFLLFLAIAVAARAKGDGSLHLHSRIHVLDLSVDVMQSGLWLVLLGFSSYLRLSWRSFAYGNTVIENSRITREMIDRAADALGKPQRESSRRSE